MLTPFLTQETVEELYGDEPDCDLFELEAYAEQTQHENFGKRTIEELANTSVSA